MVPGQFSGTLKPDYIIPFKLSREDAIRKPKTHYKGKPFLPKSSHTQLRRGKVHYALMPVWMLNTKWQGKDFLFAMNGQTGKLVGDLPMSWGEFWGTFAAIAVPLSVIGAVISILL